MTGLDPRVGTTFGKYQIRALLGAGGMGQVYEAYDTSKDRTVALKVLADQFSHDERFRMRFSRESHAAAKLQEPHVIPIHDWGEIDGSCYIDMRLVQGTTLQRMLSDGPLEPSRAVAITNQIAAALDAAHAEGLFHRDVKPANIIVTPADFAYLLDFGIAEAKGETHLTMTGTHIGSFAYMAPERFDDGPASASVDVYSLACVLYEALTGHTPFATNSMEQVIAAHLTAAPPRPSLTNPRVPASFDDVIVRGMAKDPSDRFPSAGAFGRAAQQALRQDWHTAETDTWLAPQVASPALTHDAPAPTTPGYAGPAYAGPGPQRWPPIAPYPAPPPRGQPRWLVPTVIAVAAILTLGGIGVVIGVLVSGNSKPSETHSAATGDDASPPAVSEPDSPRGPVSPRRPPSAPLPPPVLAPDPSPYPVNCVDDYSLPGNTGWGSHARRGSDRTSCSFTRSVLEAYWDQYGSASRDLRHVSAAGSVPCDPARALCDGTQFVMQCEARGSDSWITCTGGIDGNTAVVYLY